MKLPCDICILKFLNSFETASTFRLPPRYIFLKTKEPSYPLSLPPPPHDFRSSAKFFQTQATLLLPFLFFFPPDLSTSNSPMRSDFAIGALFLPLSNFFLSLKSEESDDLYSFYTLLVFLFLFELHPPPILMMILSSLWPPSRVF